MAAITQPLATTCAKEARVVVCPARGGAESRAPVGLRHGRMPHMMGDMRDAVAAAHGRRGSCCCMVDA